MHITIYMKALQLVEPMTAKNAGVSEESEMVEDPICYKQKSLMI